MLSAWRCWPSTAARAGAQDALLAAAMLARLEANLHEQTGDADACIAEFFDVAAGAGLGRHRLPSPGLLLDPCREPAPRAPVQAAAASSPLVVSYDGSRCSGVGSAVNEVRASLRLNKVGSFLSGSLKHVTEVVMW